MDTKKRKDEVGFGGYIALILIIIFFSGVLKDLDNPLKFFDYSVLSGTFGTIGETGHNFQGAGGSGAKAGFLFALNLVPNVMLAIGAVAVAEQFGAIKAAQKLLTPLLGALLGIPGYAGLALITSMQSTDAGASMTKLLYDQGRLTQDEVDIFSVWQFSRAGSIGNFFGTAAGLWALMNTDGTPAVKVSMITVFLIIFVMKFVGANIMRFVFVRNKQSSTDVKEEVVVETAEKKEEKQNPTMTFVAGAKNGYNIGIGSIIPNVLMAYVVIKALNVTGVMDLLGTVLSPIMGIFGLPGEAAAVLLGSLMSIGGGVGVAGALFAEGALNGAHIAILSPAILLIGSIIQYSGRLLAVAGAKRQPQQFLICFINAIIAMIIMRIIV